MKHNQDINKIILIIFIFVYLLSIMCGTTYCYPADIINETTNQHKIQSVVDLIEQKEYKKALTNLEQIENIDQCMFQFYKKQLAELLENYKKILIDDANYYTANGDFAFALNLLNNKQKYFKDDKNIQALIEHNYNQVRKNKLTEYAGKIAILNTNCLLSFPSKALNPKNPLYEQFDNRRYRRQYGRILHRLDRRAAAGRRLSGGGDRPGWRAGIAFGERAQTRCIGTGHDAA